MAKKGSLWLFYTQKGIFINSIEKPLFYYPSEALLQSPKRKNICTVYANIFAIIHILMSCYVILFQLVLKGLSLDLQNLCSL